VSGTACGTSGMSTESRTMTERQTNDVLGQTGDAATLVREVVVSNSQGLHARPADALAREARKWQSRIELVADSQRADGKSILELLTLAAEAGTRLVVEATGPDAREALEAIGSLFARNFDEHMTERDS